MFFRSMSIPSDSPHTSICVYCGSQSGRNPAYGEAARILGRTMAANGIGLVYGGGTRGIMGTVADAVMSNGGKVTGIIPEFLMDKEATRHSLGQLDELVVTADMHERKHLMFDRSDAFVALPGGIGTLEEIIEIMTWAQLGRHTKPIVLADVGNFWKPLESLIDHMKDQGFIHTAHLVQPLVISDPAEIVPAVLDLLARTAPQEGVSEVIENL
ncbi:TIGR00730 family Rossman fold protein [Pseudohoeflea suaedae]|uniref:Cytokinin riboside 5'-monophosphate phosphoribohydrolase n=2 Tax=Pseudohoeflea suaedae TaxID=877384 RepID=A0A4R5PKR8_9HYPH|nr:TIGR00730 family Rossman fold protein [Pseudohoeflea suaedae]